MVHYDYKVGDKIMLTNNTDFKYERPYKEPYQITHG